MLGRRDRSAFELALKLRKKGFSGQMVSALISSLQAASYLDDLRFARAWVRFRIESHRFGPLRIRRELLEKGIPTGEIETALLEAEADFDFEAVAEAALRARYGDLSVLQDRRLRRKAFDFLRRKGHAAELITRLFQELGGPGR